MKLRFEYQIAFAYLIISGLWIFFSDHLIESFAVNKESLSILQTFKGWFFVLATSMMLFFYVRSHLNKKRQYEIQLKNNNKQLESYQKALKEKVDDYYSLLEEYKTQNEDLINSKNESEKEREQLSFLLDYAPDPVFIYSDRKFAYLNQRAMKLFGYHDVNSALGKSVSAVFEDTSEEKVMRDFEYVKTEYSSRLQREFRVIDPSGKKTDVEASAVPIVYQKQPSTLVFLRDVSQSKDYLKQIEEKNLFIQTIMDNLPIGIALNKFNEGDATYMNKKFVDIYGWPAGELVNIEAFFEKVYPDKNYRNEIVKMISKDIATGDPAAMHWENITITRKNGEKRIVNAVNIPLPEQNTMISTVIDVTELKNIEKSLIIAKEKAEESDRLKTAFLNNISHEFRTPLNGILGFVEMLMKEGLREDKKQKYISIIRESSNKLVDIVTDTVEVSHIQSGKSELNHRQFQIDQVLEEILLIYKPVMEKKGIEFKKNIMLADINNIILSDRHKLYRIIKHLLDNAVKFTEKGSIDFSIGRKDRDLLIKVADTGVGIAPEVQNTVYNVFRQSELGYSRSFGGNGIGLFIVKSYVQMMDGKIEMESELNKGSCFTVNLPVFQE